MASIIPVVLFTYARPAHLKQTLACLQENQVPLVYAFSDGPKGSETALRVTAVRELLHQVDWCEIHIFEREKNLGLGASIRSGVSDVFQKHNALIVFEDDLICVPGTYRFLAAALEHYKDDPAVMSVTGWTHPLVTPSDVADQPYFDGRAESWSWGTWSRVWKDMEEDALSIMRTCIRNNIDIYRYGADLPEMAMDEKKKNIWAVRFAYLHMLQSGLCLRPAKSMVDHVGFDKEGTNATEPSDFAQDSLEYVPLTPNEWPVPVENSECHVLWKRQYGGKPTLPERAKRSLRRLVPTSGTKLLRFIISIFKQVVGATMKRVRS